MIFCLPHIPVQRPYQINQILTCRCKLRSKLIQDFPHNVANDILRPLYIEGKILVKYFPFSKSKWYLVMII